MQDVHVALAMGKGPKPGRIFKTNSNDQPLNIYRHPWKMNATGSLTVVSLREAGGFFKERRLPLGQLMGYQDTGEQVTFKTTDRLPHPIVEQLIYRHGDVITVSVTGEFFEFGDERYWEIAHEPEAFWVRESVLALKFEHKYEVGQTLRRTINARRVEVSKILECLPLKGLTGVPYYRVWQHAEINGESGRGREQIEPEGRL